MAKTKVSNLQLHAGRDHMANTTAARTHAGDDDALAAIHARQGRKATDVRWNPETGKLEVVYS